MAMIDYRGMRLISEDQREKQTSSSVGKPGISLKIAIIAFIDIGGIEYLDHTEVTTQKGK